MSLDISVLTHADEIAEWDEYVARHPRATNYHQTGWKSVVEQGFGHKTQYLFVREGGIVMGVLPLVIMKSRLFGCFAVSMPFFSYGGMVADSDTVEETLLAAAKRAAIAEQASQ